MDAEAAQLDAQSQYMVELPVASRERYKTKVIDAGLTKDPYTIDDWTREPLRKSTKYDLE